MTDFEKELLRHIEIQKLDLQNGDAVVLKVDFEKIDLNTSLMLMDEVQNILGSDYKVFLIPKDIDAEYMTVASLTQWRDMVDKKVRSMCGGAKMGEGERE